MSTIDEINKALAEGNALAPTLIGLIALFKKQGDSRTTDEILQDASSTAEATKALTLADMGDG